MQAVTQLGNALHVSDSTCPVGMRVPGWHKVCKSYRYPMSVMCDADPKVCGRGATMRVQLKSVWGVCVVEYTILFSMLFLVTVGAVSLAGMGLLDWWRDLAEDTVRLQEQISVPSTILQPVARTQPVQTDPGIPAPSMDYTVSQVLLGSERIPQQPPLRSGE